MKTTSSILILPIALAFGLSACGKKAAPDAAPALEPAAEEAAEKASGAAESTSSVELKAAYHQAVAAVSQGNTELQLSKEEAEAQILAINPQMFSAENIPADLDKSITDSHSELKQMLGDRPLPFFAAHLVEKEGLGTITQAEKILLSRALTDITSVVKLAMTDGE